jgi:hypothetical protein
VLQEIVGMPSPPPLSSWTKGSALVLVLSDDAHTLTAGARAQL